jgi:rod shape determining protein RodA
MMFVDRRFVLAASAFLFFIIAISWIGLIRFKKRYFFWVCYTAAIIALGLLVAFAAHKVLREYQMMRLIIFLDPSVDPRGSGWHITQSITAIGSGGIYGRGFLQGTQSQYHFLPEQSTDFIFAILSEEWGFVGGVSVFALFLILILRLIRIMRLTTDAFGCYIMAGLISMYAFHFLINTGMTMGIMPVTGIPLTFLSYGGSALVTAMAGIGLALSIHIRRYQRTPL